MCRRRGNCAQHGLPTAADVWPGSLDSLNAMPGMLLATISQRTFHVPLNDTTVHINDGAGVDSNIQWRSGQLRDPVTKQTTATKIKASNRRRTAAQRRPRHEDELTGVKAKIPGSLKSENKTKPRSIKPWLPMHEENEDKAVACRAP